MRLVDCSTWRMCLKGEKAAACVDYWLRASLSLSLFIYFILAFILALTLVFMVGDC